MRGVLPPLPNTPPWRSAQLKHRDNKEVTTVRVIRRESRKQKTYLKWAYDSGDMDWIERSVIQ
jgi:hypothetical protein